MLLLIGTTGIECLKQWMCPEDSSIDYRGDPRLLNALFPALKKFEDECPITLQAITLQRGVIYGAENQAGERYYGYASSVTAVLLADYEALSAWQANQLARSRQTLFTRWFSSTVPEPDIRCCQTRMPVKWIMPLQQLSSCEHTALVFSSGTSLRNLNDQSTLNPSQESTRKEFWEFAQEAYPSKSIKIRANWFTCIAASEAWLLALPKIIQCFFLPFLFSSTKFQEQLSKRTLHRTLVNKILLQNLKFMQGDCSVLLEAIKIESNDTLLTQFIKQEPLYFLPLLFESSELQAVFFTSSLQCRYLFINTLKDILEENTKDFNQLMSSETAIQFIRNFHEEGELTLLEAYFHQHQDNAMIAVTSALRRFDEATPASAIRFVEQANHEHLPTSKTHSKR